MQYTYEQLAIIVAIPIVTICLLWTIAIFFKNRRKWAPYDVPIFSLFILSIIRNLTILSYVVILAVNKRIFKAEYCSILIWIFNSIHTFQASSLSTLAVIGLLSTKLKRKHQPLKHFLNVTHVLYHLFCLITLCACVGVAAILARHNVPKEFEIFGKTAVINLCKVMPFDLDLKYNVFIIVLHVFLASISFFCLISIVINVFRMRRRRFDYIKNSNLDISDSTCSNNNTIVNDKNFYDTYTVHRGAHCHQNFYIGEVQKQIGCCQSTREPTWNSDMSNLSTTVSSTNSRRPCIPKKLNEERKCRTGLETINPTLIVCYFVYHVPVLCLCIKPTLLHPWPVAGIALWLGLLQDILMPIGLGLVDTRFNNWVSDVYKCSGSRLDEKLPHVGLDGKFRPFGSQPRSIETVQLAQERNLKALQSVEHRFPITNGSLFTSIDGRLPVIHNYRRHKEIRGLKCESTSNPSLNRSHLKRSDMAVFHCSNCATDMCPSHSDLHHFNPDLNKKLKVLYQSDITQQPLRNTMSYEDLNFSNIEENPMYISATNNNILRNSENILRMNKLKMSKSEDSLSEMKKDQTMNAEPLIIFEEKKKNLNARHNEQILNYLSSDEEYENIDDDNHCDTLSSSSCSITTEANEDFHFYQSSQFNASNEKTRVESINQQLGKRNNDFLLAQYTKYDTTLEHFAPKGENPTSLKRSHSKRSLENFQAFLEDRQENMQKIGRSVSYMNLEDRGKKQNASKLFRSRSKLSDFTYNISKRIKSVEYLPNTNASTLLVEDWKYIHFQNMKNKNGKRFHYVGSVPDLKRVFISEYI